MFVVGCATIVAGLAFGVGWPMLIIVAPMFEICRRASDQDGLPLTTTAEELIEIYAEMAKHSLPQASEATEENK